jgi:hypothetical protein
MLSFSARIYEWQNDRMVLPVHMAGSPPNATPASLMESFFDFLRVEFSGITH